ncbi:AAA family ATPase [Agrobacterium sp. RC10-4-1]|uniref:AAA family ATPase n=1 Tax=Agrobacterium sp. RC10-4-1 TaxID=2587039 RepID=UPI00256EB2FB|nr:AAA family ATPase [Agrobacterium sp. RC10-4-1]
MDGSRQAGKTTLARQFSDVDRPCLTLDDACTLSAALADPTGFIRGIDKAVIDEIQRAPELMLAIKESVDRDERPGRFPLIGSANLATVPAVADSLAGRMAVVPLLPFAQAEIQSTSGQLLGKIFNGDGPAIGERAVFGDDLMEIVLKGGIARHCVVRRLSAGQHGLKTMSLSFLIETSAISQISTNSIGCQSCRMCLVSMQADS